MQTDSLTGLGFDCGSDLTSIGAAATKADAAPACLRKCLRFSIVFARFCL
jgi:hypothetical protein